MGRCSQSAATTKRQVPESAVRLTLVSPQACGYTVLFWMRTPHLIFGKLGKPSVNRPGQGEEKQQLACLEPVLHAKRQTEAQHRFRSTAQKAQMCICKYMPKRPAQSTVTPPQEQLRRQRQVDVSSRLARLHSETETPMNKLTRLRPPGIVAARKQLCHPVFVTVCPGQSTCTLSEHTSVPLGTDPEPSHQIRS